MSRGKIKEWDTVKIVDIDLDPIDNSLKALVGAEAIVKQITKGGLYIVETKTGDKIRIAKKYLDLVNSYDASKDVFPRWSLQPAVA